MTRIASLSPSTPSSVHESWDSHETAPSPLASPELTDRPSRDSGTWQLAQALPPSGHAYDVQHLGPGGQALGYATLSLTQDAVKAARGQDVDLRGSAARATLAGALGAGHAAADHVLESRLGPVAAGGTVFAAMDGAAALAVNSQAYCNGKISAAKATADTIVSTGTAFAAGSAAATAGALIGSAATPLGTVAGGVAGFVAGVGTYMLTKHAVKASGVHDAATQALTPMLAPAEQPLGQAMGSIGCTLNAAQQTAHEVWTGQP